MAKYKYRMMAMVVLLMLMGCTPRHDITMSMDFEHIRVTRSADERYDYQVIYLNAVGNYLDFDRRSDRIEGLRYVFEKVGDCQRHEVIRESEIVVADHWALGVDRRKKIEYHIDVKCR